MIVAVQAAVERTSTIEIRAFSDGLIGEVKAFNGRLADAGIGYRFPESPVSRWLPRTEGRHLFQEYFLAVDRAGIVRGGYILKHQDFMIGERRQRVAFYHLPLSEGLADRRFSSVGLRLLTDALRREPMLFVLGIGSMQEPLSRMLTAMAWRLRPVPFLFRILRPFRVARDLAYLRTTAARRAVLDAAAFSGVAWAGTRLHALGAAPASRRLTATVEAEFGAWADTIWDACHGRYTMVGVRDRDTLNVLYPKADPRFIRVLVEDRGVAAGWAVLLATDMRAHKYFGNLRVGSIVDCLARPGHEAGVAGAAVRWLQQTNVDLVVSNQMSAAWVNGLKRNGFLAGPSTFLFGGSKTLERLLDAGERMPGVHLNRGDGDGPIHL